jgi:hypothetical protein
MKSFGLKKKQFLVQKNFFFGFDKSDTRGATLKKHASNKKLTKPNKLGTWDLIQNTSFFHNSRMDLISWSVILH